MTLRYDGKKYVVVPVEDTAAHFDPTAHGAVLKLIEAAEAQRKKHEASVKCGCDVCFALRAFSRDA